jgi:hypothetical protein
MASTQNNTSLSTYTVHIHNNFNEFLFQSDVYETKGDANAFIEYMNSDASEGVKYIVYKNKALHSTTTPCDYVYSEPEVKEEYSVEPLSDMYIQPYGRGFILVPPPDDYRRGKKYFYDAWWNNSADAWFFKAEYLDKFIEMGAVYDDPDSLLVEDTMDLSDMKFKTYGKGLLLMPPDDNDHYGAKYFMEGWWMPTLRGWFFKQEHHDTLIEAGATFLRGSARRSRKTRSPSPEPVADLSNMKLTHYGKGYLLTPPNNHELFGKKYFLDGWWRNDLIGWFFKARHFETLRSYGAKYRSGRR